ncbi:MAG: major capsid family protein, partial [Cyanobacteria bacterium J06648_11]
MPQATMFTDRDLEYLQSELIREDFPEMLMMSGALVDIDDSIPAGAETYSSRTLTMVGRAAVLGNGADDIPMVDAFSTRFRSDIKSLVTGTRYTVQDIRAARYARIPLDAEMLRGAREVLEREADIIAYTGLPEYNILGLLNHPNVPSYALLNDGNE